jgi:Spy/CpxP family protein refolding chaperone
MLRPLVATFVVSVAVTSPATAQQSPYVSRESLAVKALTPDEIQAYLAGEGMGLALPAELNGYPGPRHVLELADSLGLTADRRARVQEIFDEMHANAVRLGKAIVAAESSLDSTFATRRAAAADLEARLTRIADLQGELRYVHLSAHVRMVALLAPEEVQAYQRLRGYDTGHQHGAHGPSGQ